MSLYLLSAVCLHQPSLLATVELSGTASLAGSSGSPSARDGSRHRECDYGYDGNRECECRPFQ